jgi:hypothetical protein
MVKTVARPVTEATILKGLNSKATMERILLLLIVAISAAQAFFTPSSFHSSFIPTSRPVHGHRLNTIERARTAKVFHPTISRSRPKHGITMIDVADLFKGANPPPENILKAVESSNRRVTAADIASAAGVPIADAQKSLSTLAMLTGGALEVSKDGEIVYAFDPSFRNTLRAR